MPPFIFLTCLFVFIASPFNLYSQSEANYKITLKEKRKYNILTIQYSNNDSVEVEKTYYGFLHMGSKGKRRTSVEIFWPCRIGYIDYGVGNISDTVTYLVDDAMVSVSPISPAKTYTAKICYPKSYKCKLIDRVFNPKLGTGLKLIIDLEKSTSDLVIYSAEKISSLYD